MVTREALPLLVVGTSRTVVEGPTMTATTTEEHRTVTVDWIKANSRYLTCALMEVEYEMGLVGVVCDWPRKQEPSRAGES